MKKPNLKKMFKGLGPGFITGASDDDPTGIGTYTQTGAMFGYKQLWLAPFSLPFMIVVQEMSGRIGIVTGRGLAWVIRKHYPRPILYTIVLGLTIANIFAIGANLGAMTASIQLLIQDLPFVPLMFLVASVILILQIVVPYRRYTNILKYLALSLLAYIATAFFIDHDWIELLKSTVLPSIEFKKEYMLNIVAVMGTTISPYLFFWQTGQEVEEAVKNKQLKNFNVGKPKMSFNNIRKMRTDTIIGMAFSNIVMFFIIASAGSVFAGGITEINTATEAAQALEPVAGEYAQGLFALGIIGTGLLAIPILAGSASYAVSEVFQWKASLSLNIKQAPGFYGVIALATATGVVINFLGISVFQTLYYAAIISGFVSPPIIFLMLRITNNKQIMGRYTNSRLINILGYLIVIIMTVSALGLIVSLVS